MDSALYKHKLGGKRQRLAAAASTEKSSHGKESSLAVWLFMQFAWGFLSPHKCQTIASLVVKDYKQLTGDDDEMMSDVKMLAGLGTDGKNENNINRDLMCSLESRPNLPSPLCFTISLKTFEQEVCSYLLLPHEWFHFLYNNYFEQWKQLICPGVAELQKFWSVVSKHPTMVSHPVQNEEGWMSKCIPITLHGDGTPITGRGKTWSKQATIFSMRSMLAGFAPNRVSQIYLWHIFDHLIDKGGLKKAFQILQWSFYWLFLGVWPDKPWDSEIKHFRLHVCHTLLIEVVTIYYCVTFFWKRSLDVLLENDFVNLLLVD